MISVYVTTTHGLSTLITALPTDSLRFCQIGSMVSSTGILVLLPEIIEQNEARTTTNQIKWHNYDETYCHNQFDCVVISRGIGRQSKWNANNGFLWAGNMALVKQFRTVVCFDGINVHSHG